MNTRNNIATLTMVVLSLIMPTYLVAQEPSIKEKEGERKSSNEDATFFYNLSQFLIPEPTKNFTPPSINNPGPDTANFPNSPFWTKLYKIAGTGPPFHAGLVFKKTDGTFAVLESGPDDTLHVFLLDIEPRLHQFKGSIQIRQAKRELTKQESETLTNFAYAQDGKRYAMWRLLLQGTIIRHRGGIKEKVFATTYFKRDRWLCAEIVVSGATMVGLLDADKVKATVTYPLDMVDDVRIDLSATYESTVYWSSQK